MRRSARLTTRRFWPVLGLALLSALVATLFGYALGQAVLGSWWSYADEGVSDDPFMAVARALAGHPAVLLADEPTGNLDSTNGEAVMDLLRELHRGGATICMVTHDPRYSAHADREIHLFDGRVVQEERRSAGATA